MKAKSFNDKYGITEKVIRGEKTQFRSIIKKGRTGNESLERLSDGRYCVRNELGKILTYRNPQYKEGDIIAVAQPYADIRGMESKLKTRGWDDKSHVKAEDMPYLMKINKVRYERLNDISDEDCLREGVTQLKFGGTKYYCFKNHAYTSPQEAYREMLGKIHGSYKVWDDNPMVFVYDFELLKRE